MEADNGHWIRDRRVARIYCGCGASGGPDKLKGKSDADLEIELMEWFKGHVAKAVKLKPS